MGLVISVGDIFELTSYSDASYGDPLLMRHSMSGSCHFLGNAPVAWLARKQRVPALSTAEAELVAASDTTRDTLWLKNLLRPFGFVEPVVVHIDNQATIAIAESNGLIRKVKHLEIKDMFVRVVCGDKKITMIYTPSEFNFADLMTKGIKSVQRFEYLRDAVMTGKRGSDNLHGLPAPPAKGLPGVPVKKN